MLFSHIRLGAGGELSSSLATFDITLLTERGEVIGEIEGFALRPIHDAGTTETLGALHRSAAVEADEPSKNPPPMGISPDDGTMAFCRIVNSDRLSGVLVLPDGFAVPKSPQGVRQPAAAGTVRKNGNELEWVLAGWWRELLGHEQVGLDDDFFDLGGHSIIVMRLFAKIKKSYGVHLGLSTLFEARTVRTLAKLIRDASNGGGARPTTGRSLVALQPKGSRPPLFVISGLGGNVIKFHGMASYLGDDQPVYGLLPRGLDGDEPFHIRVEDMAADYVRAIREVQPDGPYRVVGYSFGGAVAYEVAQQLREQGGEVGLLGLFDTIEWQYMEQVGRSLGFVQRMLTYRSQFKHAMSDGDAFGPLWRRFRSKLARSLSGLLHPLGRPSLAPANSIEDANIFAASNYRPRVYPGRLTLFRSTDRRAEDGEDAYLGWGHLISGGIDVYHIPSTHLNILQEPAVGVLSERLRECLQRDRAERTEGRGVPCSETPCGDTRQFSPVAPSFTHVGGATRPESSVA